MNDKIEDTELTKILEEVDRYLARTKMRPTEFSIAATGNRALVTKMRDRNAITTYTLSAIRKYMKDNPPAKRLAKA